jgi:hypothetical protein
VTAQANADPGSLRNAIRWGLLLAAIGTVGFRIPRLVNEFRQWRETLQIGGRSAAEGLRAFLLVDSVGALIVLAIGIALFYVLRPRAKAAP